MGIRTICFHCLHVGFCSYRGAKYKEGDESVIVRFRCFKRGCRREFTCEVERDLFFDQSRKDMLAMFKYEEECSCSICLSA